MLTAAHTYPALGSYRITVVVDATGEVVTTPFVTAGLGFVPVGPTRVFDTRSGAPMAPSSTTRVRVAGINGIPADVAAVAVNLTATDTAAGGFLTAYVPGTVRPPTSNVNFVRGQTAPNFTVVAVSGGQIEVFNGSPGTTALVVDVLGVFTHAPGTAPNHGGLNRVLDTRNTGGPIAAGTSRSVKLADRGDVQAVVNLTVTAGSGSGYLVAHAGDAPRPATSNLNFGVNTTRSNLAIVRLAPDGTMRLHASATTHVLVDVVSLLEPSSSKGYVPITPVRTLDTRTDKAIPPGGEIQAYTFTDEMLEDPLSRHSIPLVTYTVTGPTSDGWLRHRSDVGGSGQWYNGAHLNFSPGETIANTVLPPHSHGSHPPFVLNSGLITNASGGTTHLVTDVLGYFA
ncbi:hypothetical protein BJP25_17560 [Actinokineospora bangkokensis]|uniref:PKD domain-containing protein n=1 Tax=Actinokineospora bangkokensis TaxID=1193682 RepID=A0A1Q9LMR3_9PSEU|nr:hypothetical protein BJP25_17560 [Actinokineospora bangkokensis]